MRQHKGFLDATRKVTRTRRATTIGEILYDETRYNLSRVYVSRAWVVRLDIGCTARGDNRSRAIERAFQFQQMWDRLVTVYTAMSDDRLERNWIRWVERALDAADRSPVGKAPYMMELDVIANVAASRGLNLPPMPVDILDMK